MNEQNNNSYFLFTTNTLSSIKEQFFKQKRQAIDFTEQLIQNKDLSYIPEIFSCFLIEDKYLPQLDAGSMKLMQLPLLDAEMRRLLIICEILMEEAKSPGSRLFYLEDVDTFDDLIQKYIKITFCLHRMEFPLPDELLREAAFFLMEDQISMCALYKIMNCEVFADKDNTYKKILKMKGLKGILK